MWKFGGTRKFFVEAKKPVINLKDASEPAFQLRRYAWSAKLPLSILTDFEEFVIYDCRVKPDRDDKAATARIRYLTYTEYPQHWEEIASIFSREAILLKVLEDESNQSLSSQLRLFHERALSDLDRNIINSSMPNMESRYVPCWPRTKISPRLSTLETSRYSIRQQPIRASCFWIRQGVTSAEW